MSRLSESKIKVEELSDTERFSKPHIGNYCFDEVPLDDPRVWSAFHRSDVTGIFQVEKTLGKEWCKKLKPSSIEELSDLISLIRPGPLESGEAELYAKRKNKEESINYLHPALEPILKKTQGVICYQEQCSRIAMEIAGYNESEAETLRKSVAKKDTQLMSKISGDFAERCEKHGLVDKATGQKILEAIKKFQRYGFCKCLTGDTIIETNTGFKAIENIKAGECIKAPDSSLNGEEYVEVKDIIDNGEQEVFEIELESGKTIKCTANHKFLCEDGKVREMFEILYFNHKICVM